MFSGLGRKKKKKSNLNTCISALSFITTHPPTAPHLCWAGSHTRPVFHYNVNAHLQYLCLPSNYSSHHRESKACSLPTHTYSAPKEKPQPLQAAPHLPTTTTQTNLSSPGWGAGPLGCFQLLCIHTGTNILSPVPRYQHRLANIPLGNLNHTVLVIRHCPHLEIKASTPWTRSAPLPQAQVPQSLPAQDGHSALLQPCTPTSGPGFLQAKILVNK